MTPSQPKDTAPPTSGEVRAERDPLDCVCGHAENRHNPSRQGSCYACPCVEYRPASDPLDAKLRAEAAPVIDLDHWTPICVPCQRNYRCQLNGILVRLGPRAIIDADLYECPSCGHQIVRGFAHQPVEPHGPYESIYAAQDARMGAATVTDHTGHAIDISREERHFVATGELPDELQEVADMLAESGRRVRALAERRP